MYVVQCAYIEFLQLTSDMHRFVKGQITIRQSGNLTITLLEEQEDCVIVVNNNTTCRHHTSHKEGKE